MKRKQEKFSTDQLAFKLISHLIRDFQDVTEDFARFETSGIAAQNRDACSLRNSFRAPVDGMSVCDFKQTYQIQSLVKRHRFKHDTYTQKELETKSIEAFVATQERLKAWDYDNVSSFTRSVLSLAKVYVHYVLGTYDDEECRDLARFGSGSTVGVPARKANLAQRFVLPISGSKDQISWFEEEISRDIHLQQIVGEQIPEFGTTREKEVYHEVDTLKLVLVPKSYKSLRSIMPDTTIGSYMSHGLGRMIRKRLLRKSGIDLSTAQAKHRRYACIGSEHGFLATADLSAASDSITVGLLERLLPSSWYDVLCQCRIGNVLLPDGQRLHSIATFSTMGVGYTFELQTLIFLALLKGIEGTMFHPRDKGIILVYGDDMIYDRRLHIKMVPTFEELGFVVNVDKTFADGSFRESCGGDFYRGVDVRPFQPQGGSVWISPRAYESVLYKHINGILIRWSEYEVDRTLKFLASELLRVTRTIKLVPHSHPDDSGVKTFDVQGPQWLRSYPLALPKSVGHGLFRFSYLRLTSEERKEDRHGPYYWAALRGADLRSFSYDSREANARTDSLVEQLLSYATNLTVLPSYLNQQVISDSTAERRDFVGPRTPFSTRKLADYVTISHTGQYKRQVGIALFANRS